VISRRRWLQQSAGAAAATGILSGAPRPALMSAFGPDGQPAASEYLTTLHLTGTDGQPYHLKARAQTDGAASIDLPESKFEIAMLLPVRDFGRVYLYADNGGELYSPAGARELLLNYEFARSRAAFVRRYVNAARAEGVVFSSGVSERLSRGQAALARAASAGETAARAGHSNDSLADTMWAGEMAAVERARHRIGRNAPRPGFLFGCNGFRFAKSEEYVRLHNAVFNFVTVPFYRATLERVEGHPDYGNLDAILDRTAKTNVLLKGHPLVWFHRAGIPEFLKTKSFPQLRESCREYVLHNVSRYRARIHSWDVINEAHDWANELGFSQEQLLELTRLATDTTRVADPTAFRVINACSTWGEYVAEGRSYFGPLHEPVRTPFEYYKVLEEERISYEAIGLQLYNPVRDMLEVERQLERFFVFGKPVHITELGVPSSSVHAKKGVIEKLWHGKEWTPASQADWVEQFYTLCYSKPQVEAISWWDLSDQGFILDAGLLDEQYRPKEAYERLRRLIASWRA
jgi:GH35 family endo-1,4-beta-xylanase